MNRHWLIPIVAILFVLPPSLCMACLNDTSVRAAEDEFRSRYESPSNNTAPSNPLRPAAFNPWGIAGLAVGSGLIAGSSLVAFRRRKQ